MGCYGRIRNRCAALIFHFTGDLTTRLGERNAERHSQSDYQT
jgi:hypothetical protein